VRKIAKTKGKPAATLGRAQGVALYAGAVLGSGVLVIPAVAAELAGPASLVAWGAMTLLTLPLALTMSLLSARFPGGGGVSTFVGKAFGPAASAIVGWTFLLAVPLGAPLVALVGGAYAAAAFGLPPGARLPFAVLILLLVLLSNYRGVGTVGRLQVAVVGGIVAVLLLTIAAAIPEMEAGRFVPFAPHGAVGVGQAAAILFWSYIGWEAVGHFSGEFGRPGRDLVPAVLWAALLVGLLYLGTAVAVVGTGTYGGWRTEAALALVIRDSLGPAAGWLAGILAILCTVAPANAYVGGAANLARSLAESGLAPRWLGASHPSRGTPIGALAFLGLASLPALALSGAGVFSVRDLLALPTAGFVATYALGAAAGVRLADGRAVRRLALVALAASLLVYPFLGWAALYPALAGSAGLLAWRLGRRRRSAGDTLPTPPTSQRRRVCPG
jgi:amino acid efflux transporter